MLLDLLSQLSSFRIVLASASPRRIEIMRQLGLEAVEVVPSTFAENLAKDGHDAVSSRCRAAPLAPGPCCCATRAPDVELVPAHHVQRSYCMATGLHKAEEVWSRLHRELESPFAQSSAGLATGGLPLEAVSGEPTVGHGSKRMLLVSADTVIELRGHGILEKPKDRDDAVRMLTMLSGRDHMVHTGLTIMVTPRTAGPHSSTTAPDTRQFCSSTHVTFAQLPVSLIAAYVATGEPLDKAGAYGIQGLAGAFVTGIRGEYSNVVGLPAAALATALREIVTDGGQAT